MREQSTRHLGIYRTGITSEQTARDNKILRILFRGTLTEGVLLHRLTLRSTEQEILQESLDRLARWEMIEVLPAHWGKARRVTLATKGRYWAEKLIAQKQLAGNQTSE